MYNHNNNDEKYAPRRMHRIFGTEEDKVNCSFYFKIGACRHGERCSRLHMKPNFSQTILMAHFYMPPPSKDESDEEESADEEFNAMNIPHNNKKIGKENYEHYENFYEDVLDELTKYGEIEEFVVCENLGDHMFGNTYVKFSTEEQAAKALVNLRGRYYCGRIIQAEYSPVTDFREGRCRQFDEHNCQRGGYCNFLHLKPIPRFARKYLQKTRQLAKYRHLKKKTDERIDWPEFPIRGDSIERRECLEEWNKLFNTEKTNNQTKLMNLINSNTNTISNNNNTSNNNNNINNNTQIQIKAPQINEIKEIQEIPTPMQSIGSNVINVSINDTNIPDKPPQTTSTAFPYMNPERVAMISGKKR